MNRTPEIKRFALLALARAEGPVPDAMLDDWCSRSSVPHPILSDVHDAKRELLADGFIDRVCDDLDGSITWTLTIAGQHKARQLA
jgi:hypothetical protein